MTAPRLDEWLVEQGHYPSRARARDAINRGCVFVGEGLIAKPSRKVIDPDSVKISDPAKSHVSRAALKLEAALELTGFCPENLTCLDLGSSTGGFCDVMLRKGAAHVYGVEVGHFQLDHSLHNHPRLTNIEGLNARELSLSHLDMQRPQFVTSDLSFISLKLALPPALEMSQKGAMGIFLVKPQFEVGREHVGKGGIVRDHNIAKQYASGLRDWLDNFPGWQSTHFAISPLKGGDGNTEYLLAGIKDD